MTQPDQDARAFWWLAGMFALLSGIFTLCLVVHLGGARVTDLTDDAGELLAPLVAAAFVGWPRAGPELLASLGRCSVRRVRLGLSEKSSGATTTWSEG